MRAILTCVLMLAGATPGLAADRIACEAPFGPDATHETLAAAFGAHNVRFDDSLDGAEGEKVAATLVYPDDPARRLEVVWWDGEKRAGIANVTVSEGSSWVFSGSLAIGQDLAEVEAANGHAFDLNGFGWDYGGAVVDWKGGVFGKQPGGCTLGVFFSPDENAGAALDAVSGDRLFSSDDPKMRAVKPVIWSIYFGYPQ